MRSIVPWADDRSGKYKKLATRLAGTAGFLIGSFCRNVMFLVLFCGFFAGVYALIAVLGYLFGIDLRD